MKFFFKPFLFFFTLILYGNKAYSIPNYQIKEMCQNKPRRSSCIKNLKFKKSNLLQGKQIEIPVVPFKK